MNLFTISDMIAPSASSVMIVNIRSIVINCYAKIRDIYETTKWCV